MRALSSVCGVLLVLPLLGEWWAPAAYLDLLTAPVALGVAALVLVRARRAPRLALLLLPLLVATSASARLTLGVPSWVRSGAQPLIDRVNAYHAEHGSYPPADAVRERDCSYSPHGDHFSLTCRGVLFTLCTYSSETGTWRSWS